LITILIVSVLKKKAQIIFIANNTTYIIVNYTNKLLI